MNKNQEFVPMEMPVKNQTLSNGLDPLVILTLLKNNWLLLTIALFVSVLLARFYVNHTLPVFLTSTTLLINESGDRALVNNDDLLQGLGLPGGMRNLENQMFIILSKAVTEKALASLPFETEFYRKTVKNQLSLYPEVPIRIIFENRDALPKGVEFMFVYLGNEKFRIECESPVFPLQKQATFGEQIEWMGVNFRIEPRNLEWLNQNINSEVFFVNHSLNQLVNYFNSRLDVELISRGGSLIKISIAGTNRYRDADFLNKLAEVFQAISLDKKNTEALRRIQFIDDQLIGISDSLSVTESRLQQFRSANRIMDVSAQGQSIIAQATLLENERARLNLEANYYDYLADYLAKDVTGELPIVPITMGITDPGLTRLVTDLADLQGQLASRGAGEMNPLQNLLAQRVRSTKEALLETLNGLRRANSLARHENEVQINRTNTQASALPVTERQLLGIERKFRLNDELYTYLLQTRAEHQMQKASNVSDSEVVDPADPRFSIVIAPNPMKIYFVGVFAGVGLPFLLILLIFILNKKLKEDDIRMLVDLPIVGYIPKSTEKTNTLVFNLPNSSIAEAFRLLRSRMQFFIKETSSPVVLLSSSMPGEGKTFVAINLASAYSLLGKKTVLVGFDLRKPSIYNDFELSNEKGLSTWLIGQDTLDQVVLKTEFDNLWLLPAGPVPPNPSELTALDKTTELIHLLKERFDYIIIDSSPIGFISDTYHLAALSDACLLVVRPKVTLKKMLEGTLRDMVQNQIKGISIVVNDATIESKQYVYGDKFGYTYDKKRKKKLSIKK